MFGALRKHEELRAQKRPFFFEFRRVIFFPSRYECDRTNGSTQKSYLMLSNISFIDFSHTVSVNRAFFVDNNQQQQQRIIITATLAVAVPTEYVHGILPRNA